MQIFEVDLFLKLTNSLQLQWKWGIWNGKKVSCLVPLWKKQPYGGNLGCFFHKTGRRKKFFFNHFICLIIIVVVVFSCLFAWEKGLTLKILNIVLYSLKHNRDNILINQLIKQDLKMKPIKYESTKLHNFQLLWHDDDVTRTLRKVSES